jgi:hypothetical protein
MVTQDHLNMDTGQVSTLTYALGLERRGAAPVRPSALSSLAEAEMGEFHGTADMFSGQNMSKPPFLVDVHLDQSIDSLCFLVFQETSESRTI